MTDKADREQATSEIDPRKDRHAARIDDPLPGPMDPGGAHAKGYSADPGPDNSDDAADPVPLAEGPAKHPAVRVPERDKHVQPTGRSEPGDAMPTDAVLGLDNN